MTLNCVEMAAYVYHSKCSDADATIKIRHVVKHLYNKVSMMNIKVFPHILKFRRVVPHLLRLLRAGGVWTLNCEQAYHALLKCQVEQVS